MINAEGLGVPHGFLTRRGGVSEGLYDSLNCGFGSGDDGLAVSENRRRAVTRIGLGPDGPPLCTLYQRHGVDCITVTEPWMPGDAPRADAMVTDRRGIVLGVLTADCAPLIFADVDAGVIGVAHAGWRGALGGVAPAAVQAMVGLGARRSSIAVAIGPCIGSDSYEVGIDFRTEFIAADERNDGFFRAAARADHYLFDLAGYVAAGLEALGLGAVESLSPDTYADRERFFSYRRACHTGEGDYGRLISLVSLGI